MTSKPSTRSFVVSGRRIESVTDRARRGSLGNPRAACPADRDDERAASREQQPVIPIPDNFDDLADWADQYLGNGVELLPRALKGAKKSVFDDPPLAYQALLLIRNTYLPMRRDGSPVMKERWETGLRQLGLECTPTHTGPRAGEFPSEYLR